MQLLQIAVRTPLRKLFTYLSDQKLERGIRVRIPFRNRNVVGFVWNETDVEPRGLKAVAEVLDQKPLFHERHLQFFERSAEYYGISLGELLASSLPKTIREGKEIQVPSIKHFVPKLPDLSDHQKKVFDQIEKCQEFSIHLIHGETGAGKTEVYLHLMEKVFSENGQILFLVPEISLTPQLEDRLKERLGAQVSVFHSQISEKKRAEAFSRAWSGQADVFLGARSALFLPFQNLKLIVVDEEHDSSYKQSERAPYHARDLAILRAQIFNHPIVLGSATPSLESWARADSKTSFIYSLPKFYEATEPVIELVDLKKVWEEEGKTFISSSLQISLEDTLMRGDQALLFLNRRGSASQRLCVACGAVDECKNCATTLTIHEDLKRAICHWCGYQKKLGLECDSCGEKEFFTGGIGTKEVEVQIKARFPEARVARLDRDQMTKRSSLGEILRPFAAGEIDILVGTQMISKGIDIPKLSLVGVILADQGLHIPDFRAHERAFQLLTQLKGRGGRRGQASRFVIQTFSPENPLFDLLKSNASFERFAKPELEVREKVSLPPFSRMSLWQLSHASELILQQNAHVLFRRMQKFAKPLQIELIGPVAAPLSRWKGVYRMHILSKAPLKGHMTTWMTAVLDSLDHEPSPLRVRLDRDPYQFL